MQQRRAGDVRGATAACFDWFADGFHALPSWRRAALERAVLRCCLDAGEGGLLLFAVAFYGQGYEAVDELLVR